MIAEKFVAAWTGRDAGAFSALCASDLHYEDPLLDAPLSGPAALGLHAQALWSAFPDVRVEIVEPPLSAGLRLALPVRATATHTGPLGELPASGRPLLVHGLFYCELDAGGERLWRVRALFDAYKAGIDLGILPRRGSVRDRALRMLQGYGLRA